MTGDEPQGTLGRVQTAVVSFPPSFARTFSERRLGTRQVCYASLGPGFALRKKEKKIGVGEGGGKRGSGGGGGLETRL